MSKLAIDMQVEFFHPVFERHRKILVDIFTKQHEENYSKADWVYIINPREVGEIEKIHVMTQEWELFEGFFRGKSKLLYYIEPAVRGLVNKEPKFWLFFDPNMAAAYFRRQPERPKNFGKKTILVFPPPNIKEPILRGFSEIVQNPDLKLVDQIRKNLELLQIADDYLAEGETKDLEPVVRQVIAELALQEVRKLTQDITNPGLSPTQLEKRLKGIFQIGWRFFRNQNHLENQYFKKLLSPKTEERAKGLRLTEKKIRDFQNQQEDSPTTTDT